MGLRLTPSQLAERLLELRKEYDRLLREFDQQYDQKPPQHLQDTEDTKEARQAS